MGLIKAAVSAISGTMQDQWKEAIRCEDLGNEILMKKKTTPTGVITNKSTIIVGPGQCAILFDNGKIIDATAEEGFYEFDESASPSFFAGQFGAVFKEMWQRFTYNGASAKQQAVFFFNTKEIINNNFGTQTPMMYADWLHSYLNELNGLLTPLSVNVRCYGQYSFKITNPALFMQEISGTADQYTKTQLVEGQMKSEILDVVQNLFSEFGSESQKVSPLDLPSKTDEIRKIMAEREFDENIRARGISIQSVAFKSVSLDENSQQKIAEYEIDANARRVRGQAVRDFGAGAREAGKSGGANNMFGIGMMNMASGGMFTSAMQGAFQDASNPIPQQPVAQPVAQTEPQPVAQPITQPVEQPVSQSEVKTVEENTTVTENEQPVTVNPNEWVCPNCNSKVTGNFCGECGTKKPEQGRFCKKCGAKLSETAKFCGECGEKVEQ